MHTTTDNLTPGNWHKALLMEDLEQSKVKMVRISGRQIAVFLSSGKVLACDNRCPHEGYPLSEGNLGEDCILTCNWHNWKFRLTSGENMYGGDRLRTYPVEVIGADEVWIDITDPPFEERYEAIMASLEDAFTDYSYDRMCREVARLIQLGADPMDTLRESILWSWKKMEFGWSHAYAGMADWLILYDEHEDEESRLACLAESISHVAYDVLREQDYPYPNSTLDFDEEIFCQSVEDENEETALAMINGGLQQGMSFADFEPALSKASLAHYNDFGHCLIYVTKAGELISRLGDTVARPLLLSLVRNIIFAAREDRIPEFRGYAEALKDWGTSDNSTPHARNWHKKSINKALQATVNCSHAEPHSIYQSLLLANAINLLSFDIAQQTKVHISVSNNIGWLDFTHGLTFANAVRKQCTKYPELWPAGLLQMACFSGRNAAFTKESNDLEQWRPDDTQHAMNSILDQVLDHGQGEHIVSVHLLKTALAVREELEIMTVEEGEILVGSLNRFVNSPIKRRQPRRTAHQSLQFVAKG
ncbi:MAG: nitrite reductase/ring-hydroxylating ferredoxin subunit [Parasphingorhabdus sp.]|jgi:nitrite reductase/ring-hydroxylating ferredoxin subunit